eukprot:COSAG02_NODE_9990_length_2056_cov_2.238631_2_plen_332_part_00
MSVPTCVIPDPSVLPAGVTSYISLSGDIVSLISPNSPERQAFETDFAADMAEAVGCSAEQVTVNAIVAVEDAGTGRRLQDSEMTVDFTIWPDPATGAAVDIEEVVSAFSAPGVSLGGLPSTTVITPETVHVYAANCGADKIAEIGTKLASCCDASTNAADCSVSIPATCSDSCNTNMVPYWDDCSLTIAGMPASEFTFDVGAMETFVNGECANGVGAATPPPPGAPPAAVSAPGVPGADAPAPAQDPVVAPAPDPVPAPAPAPSPATSKTEDPGGIRWWHKLLFISFLCSVAFIAFIDKMVCKKKDGGDKDFDDGSGDGDAEESENPIAGE